MTACLEGLIAAERRRENDYRHRKLRVGRYVNVNYYDEMSQVLRLTTHFVAEHIAGEYRAAFDNTNAYQIDVESELSVACVVSGSRTHRVRLCEVDDASLSTRHHRPHGGDRCRLCDSSATHRSEVLEVICQPSMYNPCMMHVFTMNQSNDISVLLLMSRWFNSSAEVMKVQRMCFNKFSGSDVARAGQLRATKKYKEALRLS